MTSRDVPERISWAVEHLHLEPHHRVLEVGGAPGVAADLICDRLTTGFLLEVERSERGGARIEQRCRRRIASGHLQVRTAALADIADIDEVDEHTFDRVLAVNVNVFWTSPARRECEVIARLLEPDGRLLLAYSAPSSEASKLERVEIALATAGFVHLERLVGTDVAAVAARPPQ